MRLGNRKANPSKSPSSLPLYPAGVNGEYRVAHMEPPQSGQRPESRQLQTLALELRHSSEREAHAQTSVIFRLYLSKISSSLLSGRALSRSRATAQLCVFSAGERDETRFRHCDRVSRDCRGPRPDRVAAEWSDKQQRKHGCVRSSQRTHLFLAIRHSVWIGGRCRGGNRLSRTCAVTRGNVHLGDLAIVPTIAGRNTGNIHTGGEDDRVGSCRVLTHLRSGSLDRWGFGKPDRDRRRCA